MRKNRQQRGSALTEFVIVAPIMVALVYGSIYLSDVGLFKVKAQEIARFAAWSMAIRPMSNFKDLNEHNSTIQASRDAAEEEMLDIYVDLNAARTSGPFGVSRQTVTAGLTSATVPAPRPVRMVPGAMDQQWAQPLSAMGFILSALNIGSSTNDLFSGPFRAFDLNMRGEVHGRVDLRILPPIRSQENLAGVGAQMGADMTRRDFGRTLRDQSQDGTSRNIETVIVADSWRLTDGATEKPTRDNGNAGPHARTVKNISCNAIKALPGGPALSLLVDFDCDNSVLPGGLAGAFENSPSVPTSVVFSRPYTGRREGQPNKTGAATIGQVNVLRDTGANRQFWERDAVENFESSPLYDETGANGPYRDNLNARGPGWLGCPHEQQRSCEDWR